MSAHLLPWPQAPPKQILPGRASLGLQSARPYARFRIALTTDLTASGSSETVDAASLGTVNSGEVEDYQLSIVARDFGDAPDTGAGVSMGNYETFIANNGPSHVITSGLAIGDRTGWGQRCICQMVRMLMAMLRMMILRVPLMRGTITFSTLTTAGYQLQFK